MNPTKAASFWLFITTTVIAGLQFHTPHPALGIVGLLGACMLCIALSETPPEKPVPEKDDTDQEIEIPYRNRRRNLEG